MSTQAVDQQNARRETADSQGLNLKKSHQSKKPQTDSSDMNNISPIMYNGGDSNINFLGNLDFYKNPLLKENSPESVNNYLHTNQGYRPETETPNSLSKNMMGRANSNFYQEEDTIFKKNNNPTSGNKQPQKYEFLEGEDQNIVTAKKESKHLNIMKNKNVLDSETCTEFDLIAKEINTNKRLDKMGKMINPQTQSSKPLESPMQDELTSGSDLQKWAFSKDSQQQTQKKMTSNNNPKELITRTLKSHDSNNSNPHQQQYTSQSSSHQQINIRGKMLDFGNSDSSQKHNQFGFLQNNSIEKKFFLVSEESNLRNGIQQVNSFLGEEDDDDEEEEINLLDQKNQLNPIQKNYNEVKLISHGGIIFAGLKVKQNQLAEALQELVMNRGDCQLCFEQRMYHSSLDCTKIEGPKSRKDVIQENLNRKYLTSREYYNVKIINDIIYNENTHIVSVFKDYLIFDDVSEFLKRYYNKLESIQRLPRMFEFYEKYSKVFANYVVLPENKYMFKNIERKQRLQDEIQRILMERQNQQNNEQLQHSQERQRNRHKDRFSQRGTNLNSSSISQLSNNKMFNTQFIESVANIQPSGVIEASLTSSNINISSYQEHILNSSALQIQKQLKENMDKAKIKKSKKKGGGRVEDLDFDELISKFIAKDTESNIQSSLMQSATIDKRETEKHLTSTNNENKSMKKMKEQQEKKENFNKKKGVYDYKEKKVVINQNQNLVTENRLSEISKQSDSNFKAQKQLGEKNSDGRRLSTASEQPTLGKSNIGKDTQKVPTSQQKGATVLNSQSSEGNPKSQVIDEKNPKNLTQIILNQQNQENKIELNIIQMMNNSQQKNELMNDLFKQCGSNLQSNNQNFGGNENLLITLSRNLENYIMTRNGEENIKSATGGGIVEPNTNFQGNSNNSKVVNLKQQQQQQQSTVKTPSKVAKFQEQKTPASGSVGRKGQVQKHSKKQYVKGQQIQETQQQQQQDNQNRRNNKGGIEVYDQNQYNENKSISSVQRHSNDPNSISPRAFQQNINQNNVRQVKKIVNLGKLPQQVNSNAASSREMSKEKVNQLKFANENLFKNEAHPPQLLQMNQLQSQKSQQELDYETLCQNYQCNQPASSNIRSVEKLKLYEEEIEKDYSKYQNEYGLSKTAFAKTVNTLREKSQQKEQNQFQSLQQREDINKVCQGSVEKGRRATSNQNRANSNSQSRKISQNRQSKQTQQNMETANSEYMNTKSTRLQQQDQQKNIRSIRTKTISSQNSSTCMQKSQKLSPDKNLLITNPNLMTATTLQNIMMINQSELASQGRSNSQSNFLTLKSSNPAGKGLKIKMSLNQQTSRGNSQNKNLVQKNNLGNNNNTSQTQTPKRLKLQKTKSTSNLNFNKIMTNNLNSNLATQRGRASELGILQQINQQYNLNQQPSKDVYNQMQNYGAMQPLQMNQINELPIQQIENQPSTNSYFQSNPFASSCIGTYATTSILNSPLSFKHQTNSNRNNSKSNNGGRNSSRNGNQSQHQSQKSINTHQRAGSNKSSNILIGSNNKIKVNKRMSEGGNSSKTQRQMQQQLQNQFQQNPMLMQLILQQYQNPQHQGEIDFSTTMSILGNSQIPLSQSIKNLHQQMPFGQSMKNLKSLKLGQSSHSGTGINSGAKEIQMIKPNKIKQGNAILIDQFSQHQQQAQPNQQNYSASNQNITHTTTNSTQRQITQQPTVLGQVFKAKVASKSGKNTAREDAKKKINIANHQMPSSQINETRQTAVSNMDSTIGNQDAKRMLGYSKSQESLDLIKFVAQKAAQEQLLQQYQQQQNMAQQIQRPYSQLEQTHNLQQLPYQSTQNNSSKNLMLNLKQQQQQQANENQVLFSKVKSQQHNQNHITVTDQNSQGYNQFLQQHQISFNQPSNTNHYQPPPTLQSVRNMQYQFSNSSNNTAMNSGQQQHHQQFQFKSDYEGLSTSNNNVKTPTAMILPSASDKVQSRRTSSKFNPSSTKHN